MRTVSLMTLSAAAASAAMPAGAHVGHLGELAGHDHWIAGAAVGAAVLAGILAGLRADRKNRAAGEREAPEGAPAEGSEA